ncbi:MAG TPA: beta-N-acetylhexosaminidase [Marinilabiliales bacterium]|nr:beta-N-acetylhexosaminidase [Marinilabiliales bacterium]
MRKSIFLTTCLLCITFICQAIDPTKAQADYNVIPLPNEISVQHGPSFLLTSDVRIECATQNSMMIRNAQFLSNYIKEKTGQNISFKAARAGKKRIILKTGLNSTNPEAYQLIVTSKHITITGASEAGVFYGIQTLHKSLPVSPSSVVEFPSVAINDAPRFKYRGMHLDVSRHFFAVEEIKTYIDMLAFHNVNTFHWHLTDDQGWRIEIKKHPGLTEIGSKRKETVIGQNTGKYDGIPYGGYYTQEQAKEIVAYAKDRFITVIPEIDMPGHMLGALAAYPELGCTGGPYEVWTKWGVSDNVLCAGNDQSLKFVEEVLNEIVEIFPSKYIHIGGDECPKTQWKKCDKCQQKIKDLGLHADDKHTVEERLQSYFIGAAEKMLNKKGRSIIGWDEILEGGIAPNATIMSWRGTRGGIEAAKQGHDAIMTPQSFAYFDYYQTSNTELEPLAIGGFLPVENVYKFEPQPNILTEKEKAHIIGVQANVWTEYMPNFKHVQYMAMPRIAAISEVQWTQAIKKDYSNFLNRLPRLIDYYKLLNYNYAKHVYNITSDYNVNTQKGTIDVSLSTIDKARIFYTLDGSIPTENSAVYTDTLKINESSKLRAIIIRGKDDSSTLSEDISLRKSSLKKTTALQPINKEYEFKGVTTLIDGLKGNSNYKSGRWIAFYKNDMEVVIDLGQTMSFQKLEVTTCISKYQWIFDARSIAIEVSSDNTTFTRIASKDLPPLEKNSPNGVKTHLLEFPVSNARYVKVIATSEKNIPEWHGAKGNSAYLFVDEISLN